MFTKHVYFGRSADENFDPEFTDDEDFVNLFPMDTDPTNKKTVFYQADQIPMDVIKEGVKYIVPNDFNKHQTLEERQEAKQTFTFEAFRTYPGIYLFCILHYNDVLECYLGEEGSRSMLKGTERVATIQDNIGEGYVSSAITISPEAVKEAVAQAVNLLKLGPNYYYGTPAEVISAAAFSPYYRSRIFPYRLKFRALIPFLYTVPQRVLDASLALCFYEAITNNTCCGVDVLTGFKDEIFYNENNTRANPKLVIFNSISQLPSYALSRSLITELISASPEEIQNVTQDDILRAYHHKNVNCIKDLAKIKHLPIPKFPFTWPHEYEWYKD